MSQTPYHRRVVENSSNSIWEIVRRIPKVTQSIHLSIRPTSKWEWHFEDMGRKISHGDPPLCHEY